MKYCVLFSCLFLKVGLAETPQMPQPRQQPFYPALQTNPNNIQVFDPDFFKPSQQNPNNQPGETTPKGRAYADDPKYNTKNRDEAMSKCESLREQNFSKYQECYQNELADVQKGVQKQRDEVEDKQKMPLKSAPNSLLEDQMRNPSGTEEQE